MQRKTFQTVGELVAFLQTLDQTLPALQGDYYYEVQEGFQSLSIEEIVTNKTHRNAKFWDDKTIEEFGPVFKAIKFGH